MSYVTLQSTEKKPNARKPRKKEPKLGENARLARSSIFLRGPLVKEDEPGAPSSTCWPLPHVHLGPQQTPAPSTFHTDAAVCTTIIQTRSWAARVPLDLAGQKRDAERGFTLHHRCASHGIVRSAADGRIGQAKSDAVRCSNLVDMLRQERS